MGDRISATLRERTTLGPAHAAATTERERVAAEVDAFESFLSQIRTLESVAEPPNANHQLRSSPSRALVSRSGDSSQFGDSSRSGNSTRMGDSFSEVREAYRETVLAVDHWEATYDEQTVEGSLQNEFSTELANVVLDPRGTAFSPWIANQLCLEARDAIESRTTSYGYLDAEVTSLETLATELEAVLESMRPVVDGDGSFAERRQRLETAVETLDELAATRQDYLQQLNNEADDLLRGMVYDDLTVEYPGLDSIATVRQAIDRMRLHFWAGIL